MSKKKTNKKQAYIAVDIRDDEVIATGDIKYILEMVQSWIENGEYDSAEDVTDAIKIFELGPERPLFVYSKLEITVG